MSTIQSSDAAIIRRGNSQAVEQGSNRSRNNSSATIWDSSNPNMTELLALIRQLLARFYNIQPISSTGSSSSSSSTSSMSASFATPITAMPATSDSSSTGLSTHLNLSASERNILTNLVATHNDGSKIVGATINIIEGGTADNRLNAGDKVVVKNASGQTINTKTLSDQDIYELHFRDNLVKEVNSVGEGWSFTSSIVKLRDNRLGYPEMRRYTDNNGSQGVERVLERNDYWEVVQRDNGERRYMVMRSTDDTGRAVKPSDALKDIFNNRSGYAFDCASPMPLLNLKATLDTVGEDTFDRNMQGKLILSGWYNPFDSFNGNVNNGGYNPSVRTAEAGSIRVGGHTNLAGEAARFDPTKGDSLTIGNVYYFEKPGDTETSNQGWNAIYLGEEQGAYRFWVIGVGTTSVKFNNDGSWTPTEGVFKDYYLGAVVANPNLALTRGWMSSVFA